jgi:hypothetical protein
MNVVNVVVMELMKVPVIVLDIYLIVQVTVVDMLL